MCHITISHTPGRYETSDFKNHIYLKCNFLLSCLYSFRLKFHFYKKRGCKQWRSSDTLTLGSVKTTMLNLKNVSSATSRGILLFPQARKNIVGLIHLPWIDSDLNTLNTVFPSLLNAVVVIIASQWAMTFSKNYVYYYKRYIFHRAVSFLYSK